MKHPIAPHPIALLTPHCLELNQMKRPYIRLISFLLCLAPVIAMADPPEAVVTPVDVHDRSGGRVTGQMVDGLRAGVWTYYWPNDKVRLKVRYDNEETLRTDLSSLNKIGQRVLSAEAYDIAGAPLESELLPQPCLPSVANARYCGLRHLSLNVQPQIDPCNSCARSISRCYVGPTHLLKPAIEEQLKVSGLTISFLDEAADTFMILTSFTTRNDFQEVYRIRVDVWGNRELGESSQCGIIVSADKLTIPLVNGRRDLNAAVTTDDEITLGIARYFTKIADQASRGVSKEKPVGYGLFR